MITFSGKHSAQLCTFRACRLDEYKSNIGVLYEGTLPKLPKYKPDESLPIRIILLWENKEPKIPFYGSTNFHVVGH